MANRHKVRVLQYFDWFCTQYLRVYFSAWHGNVLAALHAEAEGSVADVRSVGEPVEHVVFTNDFIC